MLSHLVGKLESIAHGLQRIECAIMTKGLARRNHAHVDILLMGRLDLLLLLLQQFNLLLNRQLFHCVGGDVSDVQSNNELRRGASLYPLPPDQAWTCETQYLALVTVIPWR